MVPGNAFGNAQAAAINTMLLRRDLFQFLDVVAASKEACKYVALIDGGFWLVKQAAAIRQVLSAGEGTIGKPAFLAQSHRGDHGDGLASLGGPAWETRRRLVSRALTPALHARVADDARAEARAALAQVPVGQVFDFAAFASTLVTRIGARWILSATVGDQAHADAIPWVEAAGVRHSAGLQGVAAGLMPSQRLRAGPSPVLRKLVGERWRAQSGSGDFITAWRDACKAQQVELNEAEVFDEIVQLLFASHHSITTTLVHCIDFLHRDPREAAKVRDCARMNTGQDQRAGDASATAHFIKEVMRFCMPTPLLFRQALVAQTIAGHAVASGDLLAISPYLLQRDAAFFPNPQHFDPARFERAIALCAYLPFGTGQRQCNFKRVAMVQMQSILDTLVLSGRFVPVTQAPDNRFAVSYPGVPYEVRFESGTA